MAFNWQAFAASVNKKRAARKAKDGGKKKTSSGKGKGKPSGGGSL